MKLHDWQQIYPEATIHAHATDDTSFFSLPVETNFLWISKENLSASEQRLLTTLTKEQKPVISNSKHPWYSALFQGKQAPVTNGRYRIIQVTFQSLGTLSDSWSEEIKSLLPALVDYFFLTETSCILVEAYSEQVLSAEELEGVFLALDGDFDTYTRLFVGAFYPYDREFTRLLQEEKELFQTEITYNKQAKCFDLGQSVIRFFAEHAVSDSYMMRCLYTNWFEDDIVAIIIALWNNQGNISSTAKELFMHRNTVQYQIDKFQKRTLLNLKKMNHLFLCYLLVMTFE
uniref:helix-turn-helix domain-containing protein n=1 Tax=Candidatus Enterococcus willemsii TaxID=1857215 RepID=UPI00403F6067